MLVALIVAADSVWADLTQSGNCDITAGGNDLLPGTGISFANYVWTGNGQLLNMGSHYIKNSVDTSGFTLDLANGDLASTGVTDANRLAGTTTSLSTSGKGGNIVLQNLGAISLGNVVTLGTTTAKAGNFTMTGQAGNAAFGNVWTRNNAGEVNGSSAAGSVAIAGSGNTSGYTLTARTILTDTDRSGRGNPGGSINISGYSGLTVTSTTAIPAAAFPAASTAGIQTRGQIGAGAVTINVGSGGMSVNGIYTASARWDAGQTGTPGAVTITTTGAASLGNVTTAYLSSIAATLPGVVNIATGGSGIAAPGNLSFGVIDAHGYRGDGVNNQVTLNGTDGSGALTGRDILADDRGVRNVVINNYYSVNLDTFATGPKYAGKGSIVTTSDWGNSGAITISSIGAGGVTLNGFSTAALQAGNAGSYGAVSITGVAGNINITGAIQTAGTTDLSTHKGPVTMATTGAGSSIFLASLNLANVSYIALTPEKWSYIQALTTGAGAVRTDTGKKVFYGGGGTTITQIKDPGGVNNGGWLVPGFGNMTADRSDDPNTFGASISASVDATVKYDGLRGVVTAESGGASGAANLGTIATIVNQGGTVSGTSATMAWRTRTTGETNSLASDVVSLDGTGTDIYVLQMSYSEAVVTAQNKGSEADLSASGALSPRRYDGGIWARAGGGGNLGAYADQTTVGNWGADTDANVAWVVLNAPGIFAIGNEALPTGTMILIR